MNEKAIWYRMISQLGFILVVSWFVARKRTVVVDLIWGEKVKNWHSKVKSAHSFRVGCPPKVR